MIRTLVQVRELVAEVLPGPTVVVAGRTVKTRRARWGLAMEDITRPHYREVWLYSPDDQCPGVVSRHFLQPL